MLLSCCLKVSRELLCVCTNSFEVSILVRSLYEKSITIFLHLKENPARDPTQIHCDTLLSMVICIHCKFCLRKFFSVCLTFFFRRFLFGCYFIYCWPSVRLHKFSSPHFNQWQIPMLCTAAASHEIYVPFICPFYPDK